MRSSREALETFQLVASEVGRILLGRELRPAMPDLADLGERTAAELTAGRGPLTRAERTGVFALVGAGHFMSHVYILALPPLFALITWWVWRTAPG